jgi:hypothetical protein
MNSWNQVQPSFKNERASLERERENQKYSSIERKLIEEVNDPNRLRNKQ